VLLVTDKNQAFLCASFYGVLLGFFWSTQYSAVVQLLPKSKIGKFTGIFPSLKSLVQVSGTAIYALVIQLYNDPKLALFLSIVPTSVISLVPLHMIDFERGIKQVEDEVRAEAKYETGDAWPVPHEKSTNSVTL
jgi:MFS-type transporter involved in bile tolerance (Atg22 family)